MENYSRDGKVSKLMTNVELWHYEFLPQGGATGKSRELHVIFTSV